MRRKGFTLLEMMLVIGLIGILSAGVIASLNPGEMLSRNRNAKRAVDLNDILGAVTAYTIDQDGTLPPGTLLPAIFGATSFSGAHLIDAFTGARTVASVDLDNDGDIDVLGGTDVGSGEVAWWELSGTPPALSWTKHAILTGFKAREVATGDVDGDTRIDLLATDKTSKRVSWWRNLGGTPPTFGTRVDISSDYKDARAVMTADVDRDGDTDVIAASDNDKSVKWFRNTGTPLTGNWSAKDIESSEEKVTEVITVDIDGDGDADVLGGFRDNLSLWINPVNPWTSAWPRYDVDSELEEAEGVVAADIDGDTDMDIVAIARTGTLSWWENDGTPAGNDWTEHSIAANFGGSSVTVSNLDLIGDRDVFAGSDGGDKIAWWENKGGGAFSGTSVVESGAEVNGVIDLFAIDVDQDTDTDVIAAMQAGNTISWWENLRLSGLSQEAPTASIESELKPVCQGGVSPVECDANGGVSLNVLIPGFITAIPVDPSFSADPVFTGYEIRLEAGTPTLHLAAPGAERGETIELRGSVGIENCLIWNVLNGYRECVLFE